MYTEIAGIILAAFWLIIFLWWAENARRALIWHADDQCPLFTNEWEWRDFRQKHGFMRLGDEDGYGMFYQTLFGVIALIVAIALAYLWPITLPIIIGYAWAEHKRKRIKKLKETL